MIITKTFMYFPNAIQKKIIKKPEKEKKILFIGRLVPEKGCPFIC